MKILVINCGSSSIKYKLYDMSNQKVMAAGGMEKVGMADSFLKVTLPGGEKKKIEASIPDHEVGISLMFKVLTDPEIGAIHSLDEIDAAGHRIVHGGVFTKSMVVTPDVIETWKQYFELAPLHNPAHLKGYEAVKKQMPNLKQVFVFDTAFHQTMPDYAYMYALPYEAYSKYKVRRYGFHGTSHRYVTWRAGEALGINPSEKKIITCHIGNGASVAAVKYGKVIDTSMGLTPLEGLMMGTRTGDIDSSAILYLMKKMNLTIDEASDLLNKKSGMAGVTEISSDMREIDDAYMAGNPRAVLGLNMYNYRIKKYIGAYAAAMNGVDAIIFTAGVGEHQYDVREGACSGLDYLGVKLDIEKNKKNCGEEEIISAPDSKVLVAVIPTDEELMIAKDTLALVQ